MIKRNNKIVSAANTYDTTRPVSDTVELDAPYEPNELDENHEEEPLLDDPKNAEDVELTPLFTELTNGVNAFETYCVTAAISLL